MSDRETALFANEAFYMAFASRDMATIEHLWADEDVTCIHPGWPPLSGREAVVGSWRNILTGGNAPNISCRNAKAMIRGTTAVITCIEVITDGGGNQQALAATNIFARTADTKEWRMLHHQAGPAHIDPRMIEEDESPPPN
jgi:ketosteroid isomerase-like protein